MDDPVASIAQDEAAALRSLREVIDGPLVEIADRLSRLIAATWPHRALVIFTRECTGRPRKVAGAEDIVNRIAITELEDLKSTVEVDGHYAGEANLAGRRLWVWAVRDRSDTLLVLVTRQRAELTWTEDLAAVFGIVATSIRQQVAQASPEYLAESRAASMERARTIAELAAAQEMVLANLLSVLRSSGLDDHRARAAATAAASDALIALRSGRATNQALSEEPLFAAFERLRREVTPLLRHKEVAAEFVAPPVEGRSIPGEVAHGARAITQSAVLVFTAQPDVDRLRIAWSPGLDDLVIDIRDSAVGGLDPEAVRQALDGRLRTLRAELTLEVVPQWGSRMTVRLPLDPPVAVSEHTELGVLNRREREVLSRIASGMRNKAIAADLGVAESTVKFHIANLFKKLGVSSRSEAAMIGTRAGLTTNA